eukprot:5812120-Amphidinium_carterae.1
MLPRLTQILDPYTQNSGIRHPTLRRVPAHLCAYRGIGLSSGSQLAVQGRESDENALCRRT